MEEVETAAEHVPQHSCYEKEDCRRCATSALLRLVERDSVADRAWTPIRSIAFNPQVCAVVVMSTYLVYFVFYLLIWCPVAWMTSELGALLCLLAAVRVAAGAIARFATFPGSFMRVRLDLEREYGRRLSQRLETAARVLETWWIDLHPRSNANVDQDDFRRHVEEAWIVRRNLTGLLEAMNAVEIEWTELSREAAESFEAVQSATRAALDACVALEPLTARLLSCLRFDFPRKRREPFDADTNRAAMVLAGAGRELARCTMMVLPHNRAAAASGKSSSSSSRSRRLFALSGGLIADAFHFVRSIVMAPCPNPLDSAFGLSLLRAELTSSYCAKQFWVEGSRGTMIDCCCIPPRFEASPTTADGTDRAPRPVPTVLYCAPNAVLYETFGLSQREGRGWVPSYASLGLQVVVWNVRGYGRTKGKPSPAQNGADGVAIVRYLREECDVPKILVHGESIGGMAATHIAHHFRGTDEISGLVADRTFANLAIEAQYLTGLRATAIALQLATFWRPNDSDSLSKYVGATCPKLITADACDHMIPDPASLKSGVAIFLELGDDAPRRLDLPRDLAIGDASQMPPPLPFELCEDGTLTDASIAHFFACARYVAQSARSGRKRVKDQGSRSVRLPFLSKKRTPRRRASKKSRSGSISSPSQAVSEGDNSPPPSSLSAMEENGVGAQLDILAWRIVQNVDGGCGQVLGRALDVDLGATRAWVCSYVTWPTQAHNKLIDGIIDPCADSEDEAQQVPSEDDDEDAAIELTKQQQPRPATPPPPPPATPEKERRQPIAYSVSDAVSALEGLLESDDGKSPQSLVDTLNFVTAFLRALAARAASNAAASSQDSRRFETTGSLLVLACGHSAMFTQKEGDAYHDWLRANFLDDTINKEATKTTTA